MSKPPTAAALRAKLREWKVPFEEEPGWETRGRPGDFANLHGMLIHHTGSDSQSDGYIDWLFTEGRASEGIPAPLVQMCTGRNGVLHLGARGRANHAGRGSGTTLAAVTKENYSAFKVELHPGADSIDGNAVYWGNEVMYDGSPAMAAAQYKTVILSSAAFCDLMGWNAASVIAHREHTARKNDPGSMLMYKIRSDVAAALKAGPGRWPAVTGGSAKPPVIVGGTTLSAAEVQELKNFVEARLDAYFTSQATNTTQQLASIKATQIDHTNRLQRIEDDTDDGSGTIVGFADFGPGPSSNPAPATTAADIIASDAHPEFFEVASAKALVDAAQPESPDAEDPETAHLSGEGGAE